MPNLELASPDLLEIASVVMPNADCAGALVARGQFHDVVLLPGVAAVRVARRTAAAAQLPRRLALLDRLCQLNLPFAVPEPLTDAVRVGERVAAAVSWLPGKPLPQGEGHPGRLGALLASLANVSLDDVADLLDRPHAYAGGDGWYDLLFGEAIPLLPERLHDTAKRRVDAAAALSPVPPCLVHGDLGGANLHWDADGSSAGAAPALRGVAESLPLRSGCVDACLAVLSVHHWTDPAAGLAEMLRVSRRRVVVLTWEQTVLEQFWLRDYFPAAFELDGQRWVDVMGLAAGLGTVSVSAVPVPRDCRDGFGGAYWARPEAYLDVAVRRSISSLAQLAAADLEPGLVRLAADLASGAWHTEHGALLELPDFDAGYRLVVIDQ